MSIELPPVPDEEFIIFGIVYAKPEYVEEVENYMQRLNILSESEPGVLDLVVCRTPEEPTVYYVYERYTGRDAFEQHTNSSEFQAFSASNMFAKPPSIKVVTQFLPMKK